MERTSVKSSVEIEDYIVRVWLAIVISPYCIVGAWCRVESKVEDYISPWVISKFLELARAYRLDQIIKLQSIWYRYGPSPRRSPWSRSLENWIKRAACWRKQLVQPITLITNVLVIYSHRLIALCEIFTMIIPNPILHTY